MIIGNTARQHLKKYRELCGLILLTMSENNMTGEDAAGHLDRVRGSQTLPNFFKHSFTVAEKEKGRKEFQKVTGYQE